MKLESIESPSICMKSSFVCACSNAIELGLNNNSKNKINIVCPSGKSDHFLNYSFQCNVFLGSSLLQVEQESFFRKLYI